MPADVPVELPVDGTGRLITTALGWSLANSLAARLGTVVLGLVLARLLLPEAYGRFAVAFVVLSVAQSVNELGVTVVVLRSSEVGSERTATTIAMLGSAVTAGLVVASAPVLAASFGAPAATGLIRLLALGIVVDGVAAIPAALLARRFLQKRRAVADLAGLVASAACAVPLATSGAGAWSLVAGMLVGNVVSTALVVRFAPDRLRPGWSWPEARGLLAAGLPLAATSLLAVAIVDVDYAVVGRTLGSAQLGAYLLAFNLSSWPVNLLSATVRRIAVPAFARLAAGGRLTVEVVVRSMQALGALAGAVAVSLSVLAGPVVAALYGPVWSDAVAAVRWLALLGAIRVVVDVADDLLTALGRSVDLVVCQVVWLAALVVALPIGARSGGVGGVAAAHCAVAAFVVLPVRIVALGRASFPVRPVVRALAAPILAGVVAAAVLTRLRRPETRPLLEVALLGPAGALLFIVALLAVMSLTNADRRVIRRVYRLPGRLVRRDEPSSVC